MRMHDMVGAVDELSSKPTPFHVYNRQADTTTVNCTVYLVVQCTVNIVHHSLYSVYCTVYSVVYKGCNLNYTCLCVLVHSGWVYGDMATDQH